MEEQCKGLHSITGLQCGNDSILDGFCHRHHSNPEAVHQKVREKRQEKVDANITFRKKRDIDAAILLLLANNYSISIFKNGKKQHEFQLERRELQ